MKRLIIIFIILIGFLFSLLFGGYFYLKTNGKGIIIEKVEQQLDKEIVFDSIDVSFPLTLEIKNLTIENVGSFEKVRCTLNPLYLLIRQIYFPVIEITSPSIEISQENKESFSLFLLKQNKNSLLDEDVSVQRILKKDTFVLFVDHLLVRNGSLVFFAVSEGEKQELFSLNGIEAKIQGLVVPQKNPLQTNFDINAKLSGFDRRFQNDDVKVYGWADFFQKDMKAKLQVSGMDQQVGLLVDLLSKDNDLTVKGKINLAFGKNKPKEDPEAFEDFFVKALQSSGARIDMKFNFKTKMDDFRMKKVELSGGLVSEK